MAAKEGKGAEIIMLHAQNFTALWAQLGLALKNRHQPWCNESNAALLLRSHERWRTRIWFDQFRQRVFCDQGRGPSEWTDVDDVRLTIWAQEECGLSRMGIDTMRRAVQMIAREQPRNECVDWLKSLEFDGEPRIEHF